MSLGKKIRLALLAALLLTIAGFLFWVGSQITRTEKQITYELPGVQNKPYLAAEHFLKKQGIPFRRVTAFKRKALRRPAHGQTLLFLANRTEMTQQQTEQLLEWAGFGGNLIVIAERKWNEQKAESGDLLLDSLGIQQYLAKDLPAEEKKEKNDRYPKLTRLYLENEQSPAYIGFDTRYHLHDSENRAHAWANSGDEITHILQLHYGDGLITVLTDPWIWQNKQIDQYDNAWLLWYLTQDSEVTLIDKTRQRSRKNHPGLLDALWKYFPEALAASLLLLLLALWHYGQRQGARLPVASRARRQLKEHLSASADFLLRRLGRAHLVQILQQDIERCAHSRLPGFRTQEEHLRWQKLAQLSRQSVDFVQNAMRPADKQQSAADFNRQVKDLQTLRKTL